MLLYMLDLYSTWIWYCNRPSEDCRSIANLCLLLSNIRKGILHYIHPVGRSVDVTINFPSPNNFLPFLLHSSSPPRTKCFPSSKYFPSINIFLFQIFCFFLRIQFKLNTALLSYCPFVCSSVTGVTSHISHIYKGINAMLIIRGPIKPYIF